MAHSCFQAVCFPAMKQADYYYLSGVSVKIDNGKLEDVHKAFLSNLFWKSVCLVERYEE